MNALAPFLGRIVAILVAWLAAQAGARWHLFISTDAQAQLVELIINVVTGLLLVYSASHKWLDKWINPGDAASSHLAESESVESARLKRNSL